MFLKIYFLLCIIVYISLSMRCSKKCTCDSDYATVWCKDIAFVEELPIQESHVAEIYLKQSLVVFSVITKYFPSLQRLYLQKCDITKDNEALIKTGVFEDYELYEFRLEIQTLEIQTNSNSGFLNFLKQMFVSFILA